jgi:hypothetical protein
LQSLHIVPGVAQFDGRRHVTLPSSYVRALPGAAVVNMTPLADSFSTLATRPQLGSSKPDRFNRGCL